MNFWIAIIALLLIGLVILLVPLIRRTVADHADPRLQQNIAIAREKKQLLQQQFDEGQLDQAEYDAAYVDLQTALALELEQGERGEGLKQGKWMSALLFVLIPLASLLLYFSFGNYAVVENPQLAAVVKQVDRQAVANMSFEEMLAGIKDKLKQQPNDAGGWFALGQTYMGLQQYDQAVAAFQRCYDLAGDEPAVMFSLADALALQNDGSLIGEPEALIARGLQLAPRYPNGLWLAGLVAEQKQEFKKAHDYWSTLLPLIADNEQSAIEVERLIAVLEQRDPKLTQQAGQVSAITLQVDIDAGLRARSNPEDSVFVYAKAMQGPPMPLAVKKIQLRDLPLSLTLDDNDAMISSMKLSSFDQVIVGARLSKSGNPVAQAGDFYTERDSVNSASPPALIELIIDQIK